MACLVKYNSFTYTKRLIMTRTFFKKRHFSWAQYFFSDIKLCMFLFFFFCVVHLILIGCKWKLSLTLNAFINKERCSLGIAIPENLFQKIVTCFFLICCSQMTLSNFLQQLPKVKKNESLLLVRPSSSLRRCLHIQLHVFCL